MIADFETIAGNPNFDPITGEPGAHPLGTGIGAAAAGAVGTAIGATAGPLGAVVGAVVGSVMGGLVGKHAAEAVNPTVIKSGRRQSQDNIRPDQSYEAHQLAYQIGYQGYLDHIDENMSYAEIEPELEHEYQRELELEGDGVSVSWDEARHAVKDAWERARRNDFFYTEDLYWRDNYRLQPYYNLDLSYEDYQPAYRLGYESYVEHADSDQTYAQVEPELRRTYDISDASSNLPWPDAVHAVRDAWFRAEQEFMP